MLDVEKIRLDFPVLNQQINGKQLVYLDNAASNQKPQCVIDSIVDYYTNNHSNIHRGVHTLSSNATRAFENARVKVQKFIHAEESAEIIFTRGTTEAINLVAHSFGKTFFQKGDEVLITAMEHHSNIVPWQLLVEEIGIQLVVVPIDSKGQIDLTDFQRLLSSKTKLVSVTHVSNALGTINPIAEIIALAHQQGIPVLVDGAQASAHCRVDVQKLDVDFYAFSSHKLYGPTGVGVLYGKRKWLEKMKPYQGGGDMIEKVTFSGSTFAEIPAKFEAGTPAICEVISLGVAIDYLQNIGLDVIAEHEQSVLAYGTSVLESIAGLQIIGTAEQKTSVLSFVLEGIHPHDVGTLLDQEGIAIRTGHHCAQPVMDFFKIPATSRASISMYNTRQEMDRLGEAILKTIRMFAL